MQRGLDQRPGARQTVLEVRAPADQVGALRVAEIVVVQVPVGELQVQIADEIAAAAELIMNKLDARPVAIVRGYRFPVSAEPGTGRDLVMDPARDLFR